MADGKAASGSSDGELSVLPVQLMSDPVLSSVGFRHCAPEQPGERVLSLSSNQKENTLLVSGDTSGRLQIWDISHFGLDIQQQVSRSLHLSPRGRSLACST